LLSKLSSFQRAVGQRQLAGLDPVSQIAERLRGLGKRVLTRTQCGRRLPSREANCGNGFTSVW